MEAINNIVGILANWWQLIAGLVVVLIFLQKKWSLGSRVLAKISGTSRKVEELTNLWRTGLAEIQRLDIEDARLYSLRTSGMPRLERCEVQQLALGELPWLTLPAVLESRKQEHPAVNKSHGFAVGSDFRQTGERPIRFVASDYTMVRAARAHAILPPIISANAIIFCPETMRVLVHIRGPKVATYKNAIHFIGGNYEPSVGTERFDDADVESPLRGTALREIKEETGIQIKEPPDAFVIISEEVSSGFVQFTYAGISVSSTTVKLDPSAEGGLLWCTLPDLVRFAESGNFSGHEQDSFGIVPSFAVCLLIWLKLGAPDERRGCPIKTEAQKTYSAMLPYIKRRLAKYKLNEHGE